MWIMPSEFDQILVSDSPMVDVRAPLEYAKGSFPRATNLPLLQDDERARVGYCYKQQGQSAAVVLGHQLVCGVIKQSRLAAWVAFVQQHQDAIFYCFRGGLRSHTIQQWLQESGYDMRFITGGYKALRQHVLKTIECLVEQLPMFVISGYTGVGKTDLLIRLYRYLDLEALANHRGSSFGRLPGGQPGQVDFENKLAIKLLQLRQDGLQPLSIEDESRLIGRCMLPPGLQNKLKSTAIVLLESPLHERVDRIWRDYIQQALPFYEQQYQHHAVYAFGRVLQDNLSRIHKRLGTRTHGEISRLLDHALLEHHRLGDPIGHRVWIKALLERYYDPLYEYQLSKKQARVIFRGDANAVYNWLQQACNVT